MWREYIVLAGLVLLSEKCGKAMQRVVAERHAGPTGKTAAIASGPTLLAATHPKTYEYRIVIRVVIMEVERISFLTHLHGPCSWKQQCGGSTLSWRPLSCCLRNAARRCHAWWQNGKVS